MDKGERWLSRMAKISGERASLSVTTQRGKRTFTGIVSANEIKFNREGGQNRSEFTSKRSTT